MGTNLGTNEKDRINCNRIGLLPQRIGYRRQRIGSAFEINGDISVGTFAVRGHHFFGLLVKVCPFILSQKNKKFTIKFNKFIINYTILVLAIFSSS